MREYELGQLLVNDLLPEDMRDYSRVLSKGTIGKMMTELAKKHPDQYKEISHKLLQLGYHTSYLTGGDTFSLADMAPTKISKVMQKELNTEVQAILARARKAGVKTNDPKVNKAIIDACIKWSEKSDKGTTDESDFDTNALYRQAMKNGIGAQKPGTYKSIRTGDVLYVDQNNKPVPIPVTRSYAQGLRPAEYFAGAFGTRKGIVDLQKATQDAGYLCLSGEELVRMADFSVKKIKDIVEGDYVLGVDDSRIAKPVKVTHLFDNGIRECYRTTFRVGTDKHSTISFVSTKEHKLLCEVVKQYREKKDNKVIHKYTYIQDVLPVGTPGDLRALPVVNYSKSTKNTRKYYRVSQDYVGELHTYDIEVDSPNHLFVLANGLIVSNSKQLVQIAHRLVVDSNEDPTQYDEKNPIGYPTDVDDADNEGALLSAPVGGYKRNTVLTPKILADLKKRGIKNILVRSVIAGGPANGGIYAYDAGIRENGGLPCQGDFVGINAVQSISEPITQAAISCLHPKTKVRMADNSVKNIEDIVVGDMVLGANKDGYTNPVKVLNVFHNGIQPIYLTTYRKSVKTNSIIAIASTKEHKALQITKKSNCTGEKYNNIIRELPIGEKGKHVSVVLARGPETNINGYKEPCALLLGLLLGDGCYTTNVDRPYFSCADTSLIEETKEYMESINCRFSFHKGSEYYYRVSGLNNTGNGDNTRNPAKQLLLKYNMFGKYSFEKEIPEEANNWDSESISQLVSGLIITDGSIFKNKQAKHYHINYTSTSYKLVKQVKDLLFRYCGASCAKIHKNNSGRNKPLYSIVYSKPAEILKVLNFIKLYGVKEPLRIKALEECSLLLTTQPYYACKRIKQEFIGNIDTIDIEVDNEDHLFVLANGMVVSNSKHSGGVAGASSGKAISGFKYINQLIQVPKHFQGGATHATVDGKVEKIRPAAQGGYYITVNGTDHYVRTDQGDDTPILVKVGDTVEAGDVMSDGIPNPAMIVKYKGIGEGRKYFTGMFRDALDRAGTPVNRRNIEALSRGLISYVKLNSEVGDYSPDDILPYTMVAADYQPRDGYTCKEPKACKGMYLEKPVLHYTIGTRLTPSVIKNLNDYNIKSVTCHKDPPPFEPEMVRGMAHAANDPDWGTKMLGSYNKESLLESTRLGAVSNTAGTSYVPALAFGKTDFGNSGALNQKQSGYNVLKNIAKFYGIN